MVCFVSCRISTDKRVARSLCHSRATCLCTAVQTGRHRNFDNAINCNLARSAKLPTGLYILLASISFLMTAQRQIISGFAGPIFASFAPNDRHLFVDEINPDPNPSPIRPRNSRALLTSLTNPTQEPRTKSFGKQATSPVESCVVSL